MQVFENILISDLGSKQTISKGWVLVDYIDFSTQQVFHVISLQN